MTYLYVGLIGLLGLAIGSFLNVVIWRVPRKESIIQPASACPQCHTSIKPRDNIPVVSWLILRGKCRQCKSPISRRYPFIELLTAVIFGGTALWQGMTWAVIPLLYLAVLAISLSMIDLDTHKLPNVIVLPSYVVVIMMYVIIGVTTHQSDVLLRSLLCGVIAYGLYFVIFFIYPAGIGWGDVKLAGILGIYLGWAGWGSLTIGIFSGFLVGGIIGGLLLLQKKADRKTGIPFGPSMFVGTYIGLIWGEAIWSQYLKVIGFE